MKGLGITLVRREIRCAVVRTSGDISESEVTDVRVLFAREISSRFMAVAKLLKEMVARDGIEPPTPAFSGPRSTN